MKLLIVISMALVLNACSKSSSWTQTSPANKMPAKSFSLDPEKEFLYVGVFGQNMGTPDHGRIENSLESLKIQNRIDSFEVIARGIEGGAGYCVQILNRSNRDIVLDQLKNLETDPNHTFYSLISVNNCDCYREDFVCDYFPPSN